jgi:hypothetical protein
VAAGPPAGTGRIRVVTWNIRAAIGPGEPFPPAWWRHVRQDRLAGRFEGQGHGCAGRRSCGYILKAIGDQTYQEG